MIEADAEARAVLDRLASSSGYRLKLSANTPGRVCFALVRRQDDSLSLAAQGKG